MQAFGGKKWSSWVLLIMIFAGGNRLKSQIISPTYRMRPLTVNNGLPQGWITDINQDSKGFIWMVASGLLRYDGRSFRSYQHREGDSSSLLKSSPLTIQPDDSGNLLIIYTAPDARLPTKPVDLFNTITGKARHLSAEPPFRWMQQLSSIVLALQAGGKYFIGNNRELITFDIVSGRHQNIQLPSGEELLSLGEDRYKQIWATTTGHLCQLKNNKLVPVAAIPVAVTINLASASTQLGRRLHAEKLFEDVAGNIITLGLDCVFAYQPSTGKTRVLPLPVSSQLPVGLVKGKYGQFYFQLNGSIWQMGSNGFTSIPVEKVAGENFGEHLLVDQSGTVWAMKQDANGLRLYDFQPASFHSFTYKNGFSHDVLEPWLKNTIPYADHGSYGTRFTKDTAGNVWVLNYKLHGKDGKPVESTTIYKLTSNTISPSTDTTKRISQFAFDKHNQLWIIRSHIFFYIERLDPVTGIHYPFAQYPTEADNQSNGYLTTTDNKLCVVEGSRLRVYDVATASCTIYNSTQLGLEKELLMAVPDPRNAGQLWITSQGSGISKLNLRTDKTEHLTEKNGLPNNTVYMMVPDKKGFFWCSSNKGIFRFNPTDYSIVSFTVEDGLPGNEFNRFHFIESPDGHFMFGGTEGYTIFHPDSVYIDDFKPAAVISDILVNNQPLASAFPDLDNSITNNPDKLKLTYNQNFLSFSFSALQFTNPRKIRYRYQLEGIDKDWIIAGPEGTAGYTFLPSGSYVFKVNASNTDGIWSNRVKTLEITILPPWWKTVWAYLIYLVLAGLIIYLLYRTWLRRIRIHQRIVLQQKEAEQLRAMDQMKSRFFSNITHEFRTPLTLITAPLEELQRNGLADDLKLKLRGVQRNANQLLHLINQLLDMAKLEANSMSLDLQRGQLVGFIREVCDGFLPRATARQLALTFESNIADKEYLFDADKLQKIVANLLSNALKFTPNGGLITLVLDETSSKNDKSYFNLTVADTGIGIPVEKMPFVFDRFYQVDDTSTKAYAGTGIGLALVKELTELMGGTIEVSKNAKSAGTFFTLQLPLLPAIGNEVLIPVVVDETIAPEMTMAPPEVVLATDKPLLLIAEDNAELNAFIASSFQNEYRVITASNGQQGLDMAMQELPDIIISDARMPELDGFSFCQTIKQNPTTSHIAFVLLTAKATQQSRVEGLKSQADDYVTKPFHVEELQLRIRNILQRQQKLRSYYNRQLTEPEIELPITKEENPFLQELYNYLDAHLDDPDLNVEKLAMAVLVSQRTLSRKLNAIAGITAIELIKQYRLKKAAALLLNGTSVTETAFATGYDNPNYFSTAFKGFYKLSPTEYVRQHTNAV